MDLIEGGDENVEKRAGRSSTPEARKSIVETKGSSIASGKRSKSNDKDKENRIKAFKKYIGEFKEQDVRAFSSFSKTEKDNGIKKDDSANRF